MKFKDKSVLWNWGWSYLLILLIPLVTNFINYQINVNTMKDELVEVNQLVLDNATDNIDRYLELMRENYRYVFLNDSFNNLLLKDKKDPMFYRYVAEFQEQLSNHLNGMQDVSCMIYLKEMDYLITESNSCPAEDYYPGMKYTHQEVIDYTEWKNFLNADYNGIWLIERGVSFGNQNESLVYANTIKVHGRITCNVLVSIPLTVIENAARYLKEGAWLLLDVEDVGSLAFCEGKLTAIPKWMTEEVTLIRIYEDSVFSDISYTLVFSEQGIKDELRGVRNTFWLNTSISIIFAIIGIVLIMRMNYRPIQSVMELIEDRKNATNQNEFEKMKKVYLRMKQEEDFSQRQIEKQKKELMNAMFLMMMKGRSVKWLEEYERENWKVALNNKIAIVSFMLPLEQNNIEFDELNFFVVDNIFSELMGREKCYHIEDGCFVFYLFDLDSDTEEVWRQSALEKTDYVCSLIQDKLNISILGVVSEIGDDIGGVKYLYQNVMEAFEYGKVVGERSVIDVRELPNYNEFYLLEEWMDEEFREAFASRDITKACDIVDKIFENQDSNFTNIAMAKILSYKAFSIVTDIFRIYVTDIMQQEVAIGYFEVMSRAQTVEKMKGYFKELLQIQFREISAQQKRESKGLVAEVMKYIEDNYVDFNLNLNSVAEALGKNSRHISRVFKENTEMGVLDYINSVRIKKAKILLVSHEYTIEEVAEQVGYNSARTFRRAFTKMTGEMPGMYK